ncbi:hypothetical protein BMD20_10090 [Burkholderia multivorans]|nr:hypothetical protein BMD20_10090 [Burkholderia multivorans]
MDRAPRAHGVPAGRLGGGDAAVRARHRATARASACTRRANALQSNHAGGVAAAPINLSLKRK